MEKREMIVGSEKGRIFGVAVEVAGKLPISIRVTLNQTASKFKVTTLIMCFLLSLGNVFSQDINRSTTYVRSCFEDRECFSMSNSSLLIYNTQNNLLILEVDFHDFKTGNDSLDKWLHDLEHTHLVFKGHLNANELLVLTQHNSKSFMINGLIEFNGVSKPYTSEISLFEISNPSLLFVNNGQDYFDRLNVNFHLVFDPQDFNVDKEHNHFKESVSVSIYRGYLNELRPGVELTLRDK